MGGLSPYTGEWTWILVLMGPLCEHISTSSWTPQSFGPKVCADSCVPSATTLVSLERQISSQSEYEAQRMMLPVVVRPFTRHKKGALRP